MPDASTMQVGVRYVVTVASEEGEFQVGDKIILYPDGDLGNITAAGWIEAVNVPEATRGMLCEVAAPPAAIQGEAGDTGGHFHLIGASAQTVPGD